MKGPAGKCRYCDQEFMSKQSLAKHEAEKCLSRPSEPEVEAKPEPWRKRQMIGNRTVWVPNHE